MTLVSGHVQPTKAQSASGALTQHVWLHCLHVQPNAAIVRAAPTVLAVKKKRKPEINAGPPCSHFCSMYRCIYNR
jgi:hypothetical protein